MRQQTSKLNINSKKNYVLLVYDEKVSRHFWKIASVTRALTSRDSEIEGAILRIKKINAILKRPVNKIFPIEFTYHETNQTNKAGKQKLR